MPQPATPTFAETLRRHGLALTRDRCTTLQVNVGFVCNLACRHRHLEGGPQRGEMMTRATMDAVIAAARRFSFTAIDITGGAPEMVPDLDYLVRSLAPLTPRLVVRTNLLALDDRLTELYREVGAVLAASFPALSASQTDAQRGDGVWQRSIEGLRRLNGVGYGVPGSGLELDLVSNPGGAFLPAGQTQAEKRFRSELARRHDVSFNTLYLFANVPLGRFLTWLEESGNLRGYRDKLAEGFNPCTVAGLMCRSQLCVDWRGYLFDCDFHLAAGMPLGGRWREISTLAEVPEPGCVIIPAEHCFACTVGSGFT